MDRVPRLGILYGANIAGAVVGCLGAGFYLLRVYDMGTATYTAAAINAANAAGGGAISLAIGLYAVTAHTVVQRTQEIGIRIALGAERRHVVQIVLRRALAQLALGITAGVGCTLAWERLFSANAPLVGQRMSDPMNLAAVSAVLTGVALVACLSPVWRATRVDPVVALRYE